MKVSTLTNVCIGIVAFFAIHKFLVLFEPSSIERSTSELDHQPVVLPAWSRQGPSKIISNPAKVKSPLQNKTMLFSNSPKSRQELPGFADDFTEYVFGSLIEREANSYNLFLTTFMLCHAHLEAGSAWVKQKRIHPFAKANWNRAISRFRGVTYYPSGERTPSPAFYCRIKESSSSEAYTVAGTFVPNKLSPDVNANKLLDVFRCPLATPKASFEKFAYTDEEIYVEILREGVTVIHFSVPWRTRTVGYMLSPPSHGTNADAWRGYATPEAPLERIHVCVPGTRRHLSRKELPNFLEFISHHIQIGASHIYLPLAVGKSSLPMKSALRILRSYIAEGKVSVVSTSEDEVDLVPSFSGMSWPILGIKLLHINFCLYQAKGVADYVSLLDADEFFVPLLPHTSIPQVLAALESPVPIPPASVHDEEGLKSLQQTWKPAPGLADGEGHPFCHLILQSYSVFNAPGESRNYDQLDPWVGSRFKQGRKNIPYGTQKAIFPTRQIFAGGFNAPGACLLPMAHRACVDPSETDLECSKLLSPKRNGSFHTDHSYFETVSDADGKLINKDTEALFYSFKLFEDEPRRYSALEYLPNEYTTRFFPQVMADLEARNLDMLVVVHEDTAERESIDTRVKLWPEMLGQQSSGLASARCNVRPIPKPIVSPSGYVTTLPNFASDYSDYAIGGLIERVSDSFDLWLTTFFLNHHMLTPGNTDSSDTVVNISPDVFEIWDRVASNFDKSKKHYYQSGERVQPPTVLCRITHSAGAEPYTVGGRFVPNDLTSDSNARRRLDIFRCPMKNTKEAYMTLAGADSKAVLTVEILKDDVVVLKYEIPWSKRMTGFMLDLEPGYSKLDPWKGFDRSRPGQWTHDQIHMCVPGLERIPSQKNMPANLEFIQHHLLIGIQHIFIGAVLGKTSRNMERLRRFYETFIDDGSVSLVSTAHDDLDLVYSFHGVKWFRDNIKTFHVNMCTYFSKGVADYAGVWDFDEFLLPRGDNKNIQDIIRGVVAPSPINPNYVYNFGNTTVDVEKVWTGGPGLADGEGHPFCGIVFNSVMNVSPKASPMTLRWEEPWIGQRYTHPPDMLKDGKMAFKKSIRPTRNIFYGGLHMVGACRVDPEWTPCGVEGVKNMSLGLETGVNSQFCWGEGADYGIRDRYDPQTGHDFHFNHRFDEYVYEEDSKFVDFISAGVIYHYLQINRPWMLDHTGYKSAEKNEYVSHHFTEVLEHLERRGLVLPMTVPEYITKPLLSLPAGWADSRYLFAASIPVNPAVPSISDLGSASNATSAPIASPHTLPAFALDSHHLFIGSIIERSVTTADLHLATFLLEHSTNPDDASAFPMTMFDVAQADTWRGFLKFTEASSPEFQCRLQDSPSSEQYFVDAVVSTVTLTGGCRLRVIKCKLASDSKTVINSSVRQEELSVEIYTKESATQVPRLPLHVFRVPWRTRVNCKLLATSELTSVFDPWAPIDTKSVYSLVTGLDAPSSRASLAYYLEHVQLALSTGVTRLFLSLQFGPQSHNTEWVAKALKSYIKEGFVTVLSSSADGLDYTASFAGAVWRPEIAESAVQVLLMSLLTGVAGAVVPLQVTDFIIPSRAPPSGLTTLISAPSCTTAIRRQYLLSIEPQQDAKWLAEIYPFAAETTFPSHFVGNSTHSNIGNAIRAYSLLENCDYAKTFEFSSSDSGGAESATVLTLLPELYVTDATTATRGNAYVSLYANATRDAIRKRSLDLIVDTPSEDSLPCNADTGWVDYKTFYELRKSAVKSVAGA